MVNHGFLTDAFMEHTKRDYCNYDVKSATFPSQKLLTVLLIILYVNVDFFV